MRPTDTPLQRQSPTPIRVDDIATHEILDGLARLHSLVVVSDLDGRVLWMSDALGSACGGAARHMGRRLCEAFAALPGAREKARIHEQLVHFQNHLRTSESLCDIRIDLGTRDGIARSVDLSAFRTETNSGTPIVVSIVHPTEGRADAEAALRDERDALGGILDCSPEAVLALDRFGFIVYANPAVARLLDLQMEKLIDSPIALVVPRSAELVSLLSSLGPGDALEDHLVEIERPDGSRAHVSVTTRPHDRSRRVQSVVFMRDVTERLVQCQALERKNAELEAYVHSVSHDLRSPLVSLLGFTRLLRQDYGHHLDDTGRHFADRIEQAALTMESLIDDLLELSRIGASEEHRTLVDPRAVLLQIQPSARGS
jgi:PAS domain S-box-containing protein